MDRDERRNIIVKAMVDLYDATKMIGGPNFGQYADTILAALDSRPAPTEGRVEILRRALEAVGRPKIGEGDYSWAKLGHLPQMLREQAKDALFFECEPHVTVDAWNIVQMAADELEARLATDTTPSRDEEGSVAIPRALFDFLMGAAPIDDVWFGESHPEKRGIFWWRRLLAAALKTSTPETQIVEEGERCLVCGPTCWGHHDDDRLKPTTPERAKALEEPAPETLEAFADRITAAVRRKFIGTGDDEMIAGIRESHLIFGKACAIEAISEAMRSASLSASPIEMEK